MAGGVDVTGGSNVFELRAKAVCVVKVVFFRTTDKRRATISSQSAAMETGSIGDDALRRSPPVADSHAVVRHLGSP
jgi:hypothetical protein